MRGWLYMLGGLGVWAFHFFAMYAVASLLLTSEASRLLTVALTLPCLAAAAMLAAWSWRKRAASEEPDERWPHLMAALSSGAALIAIFWQGLPAWLA